MRRKLRLAAKRHDVVALSLRDPREDEWPAVGLVELRDAETGERAVVDTADRTVRSEFAERAAAQWAGVRQLLRSAAIDQVEIRGGEDYLWPLLQCFRRRERRS